jgi:hypothetical protein
MVRVCENAGEGKVRTFCYIDVYVSIREEIMVEFVILKFSFQDFQWVAILLQ